MSKFKKLFGEINLTWKKLIILAVITGIYTAIMTIIPVISKTSFGDISVSFEVWILFGIFIIMNSKSPKDSALKCFIFFLISQPLIYLIQVPFSSQGFGIFSYYKYWFVWTILTLPMGFIGYYMKKDKWWGIIILAPILMLLGIHCYNFIRQTIYNFPFHLLTTIFCFITLFLYPICIFNDKKAKTTGIILSILIALAASVMAFTNKITYDTLILVNDKDNGIVFNENYNVYLENPKLGNIYIEYSYELENYAISAKFTKAGKTNLILEDENGNKTVYELNVGSNTFQLEKKIKSKQIKTAIPAL